MLQSLRSLQATCDVGLVTVCRQRLHRAAGFCLCEPSGLADEGLEPDEPCSWRKTHMPWGLLMQDGATGLSPKRGEEILVLKLRRERSFLTLIRKRF